MLPPKSAVMKVHTNSDMRIQGDLTSPFRCWFHYNMGLEEVPLFSKNESNIDSLSHLGFTSHDITWKCPC